METKKKSLLKIQRNGYFVFVCTYAADVEKIQCIVPLFRQPVSQPATRSAEELLKLYVNYCLTRTEYEFPKIHTVPLIHSFIHSLAHTLNPSIHRLVFRHLQCFLFNSTEHKFYYTWNTFMPLWAISTPLFVCIFPLFICSACKKENIFDAGWNKVISQWLLNYTRP